MINDVDAVLERHTNGAVGPRVAGDVNTRFFPNLDRRGHFRVSISQFLRLSLLGKFVARNINFEDIYALAYANAAGAPYFIRAVGDISHRLMIHVQLPLVTEAAGRCDLGRSSLDTRAGKTSGIDDIPQNRLKTKLGRAHASGGKQADEAMV